MQKLPLKLNQLRDSLKVYSFLGSDKAYSLKNKYGFSMSDVYCG